MEGILDLCNYTKQLRPCSRNHLGETNDKALANIEEMATTVTVHCLVHRVDGDECAAFAML